MGVLPFLVAVVLSLLGTPICLTERLRGERDLAWLWRAVMTG